MRKSLMFIFFFLTALAARANKIDSLNNDKAVGQFLLKLMKKSYPYPANYNKAKILNWKKVDLNNDNLTDLVIYATIDNDYRAYNFVVIDKGGDNFRLMQINKADTAVATINIGDRNAITFKTAELIPTKKREYLRAITIPVTDTLVYEFDGWVELNKRVVHHEIDSITFHAGACFGDCPVFYAKMNARGVIRFEKEKPVPYKFVKDPWGKPDRTPIPKPKTTLLAKIKLSADEKKGLFDLIDYMNFKNLRDNYTITSSDHSTVWVRVKYKDGSFKSIEDYGERGTFGLMTLYDKFYTLAKTKGIK